MTLASGPEGSDGASGADIVHKLRHDLANPLAAVLAETQLLLLSEHLNAETQSSLKQIEALARQMRQILQDLDA